MPSRTLDVLARAHLAWMLTSVLAGCYTGLGAGAAGGADDGADDGGGPGDSGDGGSDSGGDAVDACGVSPAPLRRLTRAQLRDTVADLLELGDAAAPALDQLAFVLDGEAGGFASTTAPPDPQVVRTQLDVAETLADTYVASRLPQTLACDWTRDDCVRPFVGTLARRAYRRPVADEELDGLMAIHAAGVAADDASTAMRAVVTAMLMSPNFQYLEEPVRVDATPELRGLVTLTPHAIATRLSFLLWNSGPDDALLDDADADALDADGIAAHVDRMLADPRFARTLDSFHGQWTHLSTIDSIASTDPAFTSELRHAMVAETLGFARDVVLAGDGRIATLLTADYTVIDATMAAFYGLPAPADPSGRVELDGVQRRGILTHASLLARFGAAFPEVHRGKFVRERLLCDRLTPPPPNVNLEADRNNNPTCQACHTYMDPIGNGFANYDAIGRWRDADGDGNPIAAAGEVVAMDGSHAPWPFTGATAMAALLADEPSVERCFAIQWGRFATGRLETSADRCAIDEFAAALATHDGDLRELVTAIATSTWFRSRSLDEL